MYQDFPDSGMIELSSDGISSSLPSLTSTDKGQQQCITKNNSNLSDPHGCIRYAKADSCKDSSAYGVFLKELPMQCM